MIIRNTSSGANIASLALGTNLDLFWAQYGLDPADHTIVYTEDEQRQIVRAGIFASHDLATLVGQIGDAMSITLHALGTLTHSLDTATTVDDIKTAMAPFAPHLTAYRDKVESGAIKLPYLEKGGLAVVMPEIEAAGTTVAEFFTAE